MHHMKTLSNLNCSKIHCFLETSVINQYWHCSIVYFSYQVFPTANKSAICVVWQFFEMTNHGMGPSGTMWHLWCILQVRIFGWWQIIKGHLQWLSISFICSSTLPCGDIPSGFSPLTYFCGEGIKCFLHADQQCGAWWLTEKESVLKPNFRLTSQINILKNKEAQEGGHGNERR